MQILRIASPLNERHAAQAKGRVKGHRPP